MTSSSTNDNPENLLTIDGKVQHPRQLTRAELAALDAGYQIADVGTLVPGRRGTAVQLTGLLEIAGVLPEADYLTLHSSADDFHASVPLSAVREGGMLVYQVDGNPLSMSAGGPYRFLVPDSAACQSAEVDECANVKFVDRIELTIGRGHDNRPTDEDEHEELHRKQG